MKAKEEQKESYKNEKQLVQNSVKADSPAGSWAFHDCGTF